MKKTVAMEIEDLQKILMMPREEAILSIDKSIWNISVLHLYK